MHICIIPSITRRRKNPPDAEIIRRLNGWLERSGISGRRLARDIGFTQATVSRALRGQLDRDSGAFRAISRKAGLSMHICITGFPEPLVDALAELWDGSEEHASAIAGLLKAAKAVSDGTRGSTGDPETASRSAAVD